MMQKVLAILALVLVSVATPPRASAQAQPAAQPPAPRPPGIDLATAKKLVAAAVAAAPDASFQFSTAVVDVNGDVVYSERMDGASSRAVTSAVGKARAAVLFGVPTKALQDAVAAGKPLTVTLTAPPVGAFELTLIQGGLPILRDGKVIAAIAVGGAKTSPMDEKLAQAAIDAVMPRK
jgi:glc operon protein GlcG